MWKITPGDLAAADRHRHRQGAVGQLGVVMLAEGEPEHPAGGPVQDRSRWSLPGPVIADRKLAGADDLCMTAACLGFAAVVYAVPVALTWPHAIPSARMLGALAGPALACTALAFVLYFALIAEVTH